MHNKMSWRNEEIASYLGIPINGYYRDMKNLRLSFILNIYDVWKGTISNIITKLDTNEYSEEYLCFFQ